MQVGTPVIKTGRCPLDFMIRSLGTSDNVVSVVQWRQKPNSRVGLGSLDEKSRREVKTISRGRCGVKEAFFRREKGGGTSREKDLKGCGRERDAW